MANRPLVVIPGDEPPQIADSPELSRLAERCEVVLHRDRPANDAEKLAREKLQSDLPALLRSVSALSGEVRGLARGA